MIPEVQPCMRQYGAGAFMAAHDHAEALLSIVVQGDFRERVAGQERDYARGHAAFCPAGMKHAQTFGARGARQIMFRPRDAWIDYLADSKVTLDDGPQAWSADFAPLGDRLFRELGAEDAFADLACEGLMLEVIAAFGRGAAGKITDMRPPPWLRAARDFIHENALGPVTLAEVAEAAGRHEVHLAREFRRYFGQSVGDYLRRLRIEHAANLLLSSRLGLSEIALESGFSSHAHLCREFKLRLGVTPSAWRARGR